MEKIINGKKIAQNIIENLKAKVEKLDVRPNLAVIIAGCDKASEIYVKNKQKRALEVGFNSILKKLPENVTKDELLKVIEDLNENPTIDGILLQLPLPEHLNEKDFLDKINPKKDVDGFTTFNSGKLFKGETPYATSCTPKGIMTVLKTLKIDLEGKIAVVVGRSNIVGKPISALLLKENATVIQAHSKTKNLEEITKMADILVSATGKQIIKRGMVKKGAVVIDVGIIRNKEGKLTGDVDLEGVLDDVSYITPVPGGIGPMTIASLMENTYELYLLRKNEKH